MEEVKQEFLEAEGSRDLNKLAVMLGVRVDSSDVQERTDRV